MAVQIIELFTDDLTGAVAAETVPFAVDGIDYTIDLTAKNAARFRKSLRPYVEHSQKQLPAPRRRRLRLEETTAGRAIIRTWAQRSSNFAIGDRGRIPREIVVAWYAAGQPR
jgi:hypothetical protein